MTDSRSKATASRRKFLKGGAVAAGAAAGGLAAPAVLAQSPLVIKMQTSWPAADIWMDFARQYVDRVEAMSGGRLKIDLLPAGAVVAAFQVLDACNDGVLDAAHTVPVYWYGKHKAADDLKGFKYRPVGLAADLMQRLGMSVAQLPGGEIVPAMERGVIDAFEFNNPSSDSRFGAQDVAKNYMLSSYHQASESFEFLFNKDFFDGLDDDLKAILEYGVEAASTANTAIALDNYSADLRKLQDESGVTVHRTPKEILDAQLKAWDELIPVLEEDEFMKRVMDSQRAWVDRVVFYELMNSPDLALAYDHYFPGKLKL